VHRENENLWLLGDPKIEARWMFFACRHSNSSIAEFRETIAISECDRYVLRTICGGGLGLQRLEAIIEFRDECLAEFDKLVASHAEVAKPGAGNRGGRPRGSYGPRQPAIKLD
jgi:hypothetical protein